MLCCCVLALLQGGFPDLRVMLCIGGIDMRSQMDVLKRGVHIVVATPGRLKDLLTKRRMNLDICRCATRMWQGWASTDECTLGWLQLCMSFVSLQLHTLALAQTTSQHIGCGVQALTSGLTTLFPLNMLLLLLQVPCAG
jgi:hypothetical protein